MLDEFQALLAARGIVLGEHEHMYIRPGWDNKTKVTLTNLALTYGTLAALVEALTYAKQDSEVVDGLLGEGK